VRFQDCNRAPIYTTQQPRKGLPGLKQTHKCQPDRICTAPDSDHTTAVALSRRAPSTNPGARDNFPLTRSATRHWRGGAVTWRETGPCSTIRRLTHPEAPRHAKPAAAGTGGADTFRYHWRRRAARVAEPPPAATGDPHPEPA
jgi:hypothetical protein